MELDGYDIKSVVPRVTWTLRSIGNQEESETRVLKA